MPDPAPLLPAPAPAPPRRGRLTAAPASGVHTLELFFDLVFVFAVSQIAHLVINPAAASYLQAALMLVSVLWVYASFVMLAANLGLEDGEIQRWMLLAGMAVFFGLSMGIPAFHRGHPAAFATFLALAATIYLVALRTAHEQEMAAHADALTSLALNAAMVIAVLLPEPWRWWMWAAVVILLLGLTGRLVAFRINAAHLSERLGLAVIIALGEGVVQAGTAVEGYLDVTRVVSAFGWLLLLSALWWGYFGLNAEGYEHSLGTHPDSARAERFTMGHVVPLAGIILVSAATPNLLRDPVAHASHIGVWNLTVGIALYLVGLNLLRLMVGEPVQLGIFGAAGALLAVTPALLQAPNVVAIIAAITCGLAVGFSYTPDGAHRGTRHRQAR